MTQESINSRLLLLIKSKGYNPNSFSVACGIKAQVLHNIIGGRLTKPSFKTLQQITSTFDDVNLDWLTSGSGEMIKTGYNNTLETHKAKEVKSLYKKSEPQHKEIDLKDKVIELQEEIISLHGEIRKLEQHIKDLERTGVSGSSAKSA